MEKIPGIFHNDYTSFHFARAMKYSFPGSLQESGGVTRGKTQRTVPHLSQDW